MAHTQHADGRGRRREPMLAGALPPVVHAQPNVASPRLPNPRGAGSGHAVIIADLGGAITDWNTGAESLFGFPRHQTLGKPLDIIVPADRCSEHLDIMHTIARNQEAILPETVRTARGGQRIDVSLTVSPLLDRSGHRTGMVTVAHDLTAHRRLEMQFRQSQKMEVFGHLAGGVAHDFNNLLTVILGYSEVLLTQVSNGGSTRDLLREIQRAGQRAESLTRQLLAFGRKQLVHAKLLDLNAAILDTEKMLRRLIGEDVVVATALAPSLPNVKIDPGQLQQIIMNLAINARDAMPRGGQLAIETRLVHFDETEVQSRPGVAPGDYVLLAIHDTGVGMDEDTKARLFEPLFTTKGPGKGTGLGLTAVNGIVRQSGGFIEVHSEVNHGSTFSVLLPRADETGSPLPSHDPRILGATGRETILLVEDADSVRTLVRHVLQSHGYAVLEASNGADAIRLIETQAEPIHILVSDVVMPQMGGRELADRLLATHPDLKVLFLSGYTSDEVNRQGFIEREAAFLQKPFTTSALAQKVREVLDAPRKP